MSMNTKSLPKKNAMYFSSPFGSTSTFKLNLCGSEKKNDCHNLLNYEILQEFF